MTNIQKFFSNSPGVIFILATLALLSITYEFIGFVGSFWEDFVSLDRTRALVFATIFVLTLGFSSSGLSIIIGRIWDLVFYLFGRAYNRPEYEPIRTAVLNELSEDYHDRQMIKELPIQAIYGTILHSYAPTSYIERLGRRWTSFNNAGLQATAMCLGAIFSISLDFSGLVSDIHLSLAGIIGIALPSITLFIGSRRLKEVLESETFFCKSLLDDRLDSAVQKISKKIGARGGSTDGVPSLDQRL